MNRSSLLAVALVLMAAPLAHAQASKEPLPVAGPLDCLKGVRAHAALLRAQPLALPPSAAQPPQAVPPKPWAGPPSVIVVINGGKGERG